jgi:hypothetical protein
MNVELKRSRQDSKHQGIFEAPRLAGALKLKSFFIELLVVTGGPGRGTWIGPDCLDPQE